MPEPAASAKFVCTARNTTEDIATLRIVVMGTPEIYGLGCWGNCCEGVVAVSVEAFDAGDFRDFAGRTATFKKHQNIDGLSNEATGYSDGRFLHQLFDAVEGTPCRIGMNRGKTSGMARVPGLEHIKGFGSSNFTNNDAVWTQTKG